jgi:single-strand DNA-binding protein
MDLKNPPALETEDNSVTLRGRLAAQSTTRTLPSGDELVSFRMTVSRPPGSRVTVDSIACSTTRARVRRSVQRARPGDWLELSGRLHRRFWRSAAGVASRYEVDVLSARLIDRRRTDA